MDKKIARQRRARKARAKIHELEMHRLCIHRTPRHIYAQLIEPESGRTLASASTLQNDVRDGLKNTGNVEAARKVGALIAAKAKELGVESVAFDRSGFRYHGRVQALADAAREGGLQF
ncbi:50S ribosomal protein L18 [Oceanococcus atlanticus]|uniref:Large ribosomal subunit protein uL18 n=1 Tax=Oceanococcus atlanticus TaxID=1317117 RepID=A0A1Y1SH22_9GAMM|nr:50S ribosomal protein L18 [Oceanococcus atlanticus]ORE88965.1 50S ribosomal protein L18 [Oceanococcus atlanticus]RZO83157.1 MAG: 50S ribosomal protein L18 [Oceanococcus sp.]